jgi:hypothetical protein
MVEHSTMLLAVSALLMCQNSLAFTTSAHSAAILSTRSALAPAAQPPVLTRHPRAHLRSRPICSAAVQQEIQPPPVITNSETQSPLSLSLSELAVVLGGLGRAKLLWQALAQGHDPWAAEAQDIVSAGAMRATLAAFSGVPGAVTHTSLATCGTRKLLVRMTDGAEIETVLIPSFSESRTTLCISSQVVSKEDTQLLNVNDCACVIINAALKDNRLPLACKHLCV